MGKFRLIAIIVVLIIALPFVLAAGYGFIAPDRPDRPATAAESGADAGGGFSIGKLFRGARSGGTADRRLASVLDTESLSLAHSVDFQLIVAFPSLLEPDEPMPEPALHDLYAEARAAGPAQRECARLVTILARSCVVRVSSARRLDDGRYLIEARLAFTPSDPVGTLPEGALIALAAGPARLDPGGTSGTIVVPAGLAGFGRERFYRLAREACARVRDAGGACIIEQILLDMQDGGAIGQPGQVALSGQVRLATYRPAAGN